MDIQDFLIAEEASIFEAMEALDKVAKKILFIARNSNLVAALTDGDIRRWILKKGNLDARVKEIANYNPKFLNEKDKGLAKRYMKKYSIEALPILDDDGKITSIVFLNNEEISRKRNLDAPVVIMAGGLGTRLYPYTKILPKPLIPIGEIPIVEHIMNKFYYYGSNQFYLIVNHKKNMIKAYFNETKRDYRITYIDEDVPLGTGGGLSLLKNQIKSAFILSNCDILIREDYGKVYQFHKKENNFKVVITRKIPDAGINLLQKAGFQ